MATAIMTPAKLEKKNRKGETPLQQAVIKADIDKATALLKQGANPNCFDNFGWTPLHEACNLGLGRMVELLVSHPSTDIVSIGGYEVLKMKLTPLHDAASNGHLEICKTLVNAGASTTLLDADGNTPVDSAFAEGHQQIVSLLKSGSAASREKVPKVTPARGDAIKEIAVSPAAPSRPLLTNETIKPASKQMSKPTPVEKLVSKLLPKPKATTTSTPVSKPASKPVSKTTSKVTSKHMTKPKDRSKPVVQISSRSNKRSAPVIDLLTQSSSTRTITSPVSTAYSPPPQLRTGGTSGSETPVLKKPRTEISQSTPKHRAAPDGSSPKFNPMFGAVAKAKKAYEPISAIQQPVTMEVDPILEPSVTKQHGTVAGLSSNQLSSMRMKAVRAALLFLYKRDRSDTVTMDDVAAELEVRRVANDLSPADLRKALKQLDNDNSIMLTGSNSIIRI